MDSEYNVAHSGRLCGPINSDGEPFHPPQNSYCSRKSTLYLRSIISCLIFLAKNIISRYFAGASVLESQKL